MTIQAQILDLLQDLKRSRGMAIILITHDLGVVARMADRVAVMYAGEIVEEGGVDDVFYRSAHPYTLGLRDAMPGLETGKHRLTPIEGTPPDLFHPPSGCGYFARCPYAMRVCERERPALDVVDPGHSARCWLHDPKSERSVERLHLRGGARA